MTTSEPTYAQKQWKLYGKMIEQMMKKTTSADLLFLEQKFEELIRKRKQELGIHDKN